MYQVYSSPKYREQGKNSLEASMYVIKNMPMNFQTVKLGMPADYIQGMTYLVRACVHYALFEDEECLNLQLNAMRSSLKHT